MLNTIFISIYLLAGTVAHANQPLHKNKPPIQKWKLQEVKLLPNPDFYGLAPFPESIKIEFKTEHEGTLTIKLLRQDTPKTYNFSKSESTHFETIQYYHNDDGKISDYSLHEKGSTFFWRNSIFISITWTWYKGSEETKEKVVDGVPMYGSYTFILKNEGVLNKGQLEFIRTNGPNDHSEFMIFQAFYSPINTATESNQ